MDFVKKHLFFIALIGTVIVVVGGAVAVTLPKSSDNGELMSSEELNKSLMRLRRPGGGYSETQVKQIKASVESRERAEAELTAAVLTANRQRLESLKMTDPQTGEPVAILPIDPATHERLNVAWLFPDVYRKATRQLVERLKATMPPNEEEIRLAAKRAMNWLKQQERAGSSEESAEAWILPPGVPRPAASQDAARRDSVGPFPRTEGYPHGFDPTGEMPDGMGTAEGYAPSTFRGGRGRQDPGKDAYSIALDRLNYERVTDPNYPLYADEGSFDFLLLDKSKRTEPEQIWKATVTYWLQQCLVDALLNTNREALAARQERADPNEPEPVLTIATAAVKRLVRVSIGALLDRRGTGLLYAYESAPQSGRRQPSYAAGQIDVGDGAALPPEANLTQRTGTQDYDVVRTDVEVIANPAELPKLMRNLTNRGFFTVLDVRISAVDRPIGLGLCAADRTTTDGGRGAVKESSYYYGGEPVVRVKLMVEAIFFADWSRPLMPVEMLSNLPDSILRPADKERKQAASATNESDA